VNHTANVDVLEVEKFSSVAHQWWDPKGPCAPLHTINPCRLKFSLQHAQLENKSVLDIGCGAGIFSESLANHGANVTGIDASAELITAAREHAELSCLTINYQHKTSGELRLKPEQQFDIITCMELLEHVPDPMLLIEDCYALLKPGGQLFISTINRNPKAYAMAIIGAEYLLNILAKQTHDYQKFIRPSELAEMCRKTRLQLQDLAGISYNVFTKSAVLCQNIDVNYLVYVTKEI